MADAPPTVGQRVVAPFDSTPDDAFTGYLDELEQVCKLATPGPWKLDDYEVYFFAGDGNMVFDLDSRGEAKALRLRGCGAEVSGQRPEGSQLANARFVETARDALPKLIAEVRRLRGHLASLSQAVHSYDDEPEANNA